MSERYDPYAELRRAAREAGITDEVCKAVYSRKVRLSHFGYAEPFGTYDQETGDLTIVNASMMGDLTEALVKRYCDEQGVIAVPMGSNIMFSVPQKAWELRQQAKGTDPRSL